MVRKSEMGITWRKEFAMLADETCERRYGLSSSRKLSYTRKHRDVVRQAATVRIETEGQLVNGE